MGIVSIDQLIAALMVDVPLLDEAEDEVAFLEGVVAADQLDLMLGKALLRSHM